MSHSTVPKCTILFLFLDCPVNLSEAEAPGKVNSGSSHENWRGQGRFESTMKTAKLAMFQRSHQQLKPATSTESIERCHNWGPPDHHPNLVSDYCDYFLFLWGAGERIVPFYSKRSWNVTWRKAIIDTGIFFKREGQELYSLLGCPLRQHCC